MRIKFKFPRVEDKPQGEASCPWCGGREAIIHQTLSKKIKDHRMEKLEGEEKKM